MNIKCPKCGSSSNRLIEFSTEFIEYSYPYSSNVCLKCNTKFVVEYKMEVLSVKDINNE